MLAIKRQPFETLDRYRERYGPRFTMRSPGVAPMVFLSDPAEVREVFSASATALHAGEGGALLMPLVGRQSWMLADGDRHRQGRTILKDTFTVATAEAHADAIRDLAQREIHRWPVDRPVALHSLLRRLGLRIIVRTIFGKDPSPGTDELVRQLLLALEVTGSIVLPVPPIRRLPHGRATWRRFLRQRERLDALLFALIEERQQTGDHTGTLGALLAARDEAGAPLSREYIRDSLMSVLVAGHETTSSALAWCLLLLAHSPHTQRRAAEEVDEHGEGHFLRAVIYETLRHRPVFVFSIPRVVKTPITIGTHTYPPAVLLVPCIYLIHHDPAWYHDPHEFRPERFSTGRPDPAVWLPWGGGRKRCPGRHLALMEMQTVLREVLGHLRVEPVAARLEGGSWRSFIITPQDGAKAVLHRRWRR